ncbi:esterase [Bacteroides sp. 214]|uniref:serine hydrolase n=1 Tax=Bacteroides sp. 214 TaxID=2302935 RepID=UPI0013CF7DA9|nr:serine hydrolase [Bacteroides sp. 214]NDW12525.1 esterase [Bacteroides sp. 214]
MKTKILFLLCMLFALQTVAQPLPQVAPEEVGMDSRRLAYADEVILDAIAKKEIPGAVLAVVHQNKLAYLKAYGNKQVYPSIEPMEVNTVFDMASVSKSMSTAVAAVILLERGKFRLQDRVKDYIPGFEGWTDEDGRTTDIRMVDIMTHTSGLPPYANVDSLQAKYGAPNPDGLIEHIATCKRDFKPRTGFQYSCLNYITLQRVIETLSGQNLRDFAKENIFDVLGMNHTDYQPKGETLALTAPTEKQKDGSVLKGVVHDPLARIMNGGISGNAGIFSNATDVALLAAALLNNGEYNGKRILSPMGVRMMRTVPNNVAQFGRTPGWDVCSPYASNNGDLFGPNTYGHTGYTGTSLIIDPDNGTAVILLTNRVHPEDAGGVVRLRSIVANAVAAAIDCPPARLYFPRYYTKVAEFAAQPSITDKDIVFLGNSLTENANWSELTGKKKIVNRGIIGDEIMGIYDRLDQILPGKPKKIFLMSGTNDVSHDLSTDEIVSRMALLIDRIQQESPKTKLYLQSLLPINESFGRYKKMTGKTDQIPAINACLKQLAEEKNIDFIDLFPLFVQPRTNIMRKELTNDGLHLKSEGYEIWGKAIKKYL